MLFPRQVLAPLPEVLVSRRRDAGNGVASFWQSSVVLRLRQISNSAQSQSGKRADIECTSDASDG